MNIDEFTRHVKLPSFTNRPESGSGALMPIHPSHGVPATVFHPAHSPGVNSGNGNGNGEGSVKNESKKKSNDMDEDRVRKIAREEDAKILPHVLDSASEAIGVAVRDFVSPEFAAVNERVNCLTKEIQEISSGRIDIHIVIPERESIVIEGRVHKVFEEVLDLVNMGEEIFLVGPSGCGKSVLAEQISRAFAKIKGWEKPRFGSQSMSGGVTESAYFGKYVPSGVGGSFEFQTTPFLDCYEYGGVFFNDEIDAGDENVSISINSAIGNGYVSIPSRVAKPMAYRHPDFVFIAAGNTYGRGADRMFVGRTQLDESTLDRLRLGTVEMDYDRGLERFLCPDSHLLDRLWGYREKVLFHRLERTVSTRFIAKAYRCLKTCEKAGKVYGYKSAYEYIDSKLFSGWTNRDVMDVRGDKTQHKTNASLLAPVESPSGKAVFSVNGSLNSTYGPKPPFADPHQSNYGEF